MTNAELRSKLILEAQRKGFGVVPNDDNTGWLVNVPARPRLPAHQQGECKTSDRAWVLAANLAREYP